MQTKFRDEARPKSGLLRVREFTMKDSYTLDIDRAGLDAGFDKHRVAYQRIFARMGLDARRCRGLLGCDGRLGVGRVHGAQRCRRGLDRHLCQLRLPGQCGAGDLGAWQKWTMVIRQTSTEFPTPGLRTIKALAEAHPDVADA